MANPGINFQGNWPEPLKADVEELIVQYQSGRDAVSSSNNTSLLDRAPESAAQSETMQGARWIAQRNSSPTGPRYAVGRTNWNGHDTLGPVKGASGENLLDNLRQLLDV